MHDSEYTARYSKEFRDIIINEVHTAIPFFATQWQKLCQMVEKHGARVERSCKHVEKAWEYAEKLIDEGKEGFATKKPPLIRSLIPLIRLNREYERLGDESSKIKRSRDSSLSKTAKDEQIKKLENKRAEISEQRAELPLPPGYIKYDYGNYLYLNAGGAGGRWVRQKKGPLNPLLWFDFKGGWEGRIQRLPEAHESRLVAAAKLAIAHDFSGMLDESDPRIIDQRIPYSGKYFKRDKFCDEYWCEKLSGIQGEDRLRRTLADVKPDLDEWREHKETSEPASASSGVKADSPNEETGGTRWWKLCEKTKVAIRRIPYWIYILTLFFAGLLTCLYYLGGLEPIKSFIHRLFTHT